MKKQNKMVVATAPENENKSLQAMSEKALSQTTLAKKLKNHQIYLNNLVPDKYFIDMVYDENLEDYLSEFDSETYDTNLLTEYIETVETMFVRQGEPVMLLEDLDDCIQEAFKEGGLDYLDGSVIEDCHYDEYNLNLKQAWCDGWQNEFAKMQAMLN